MGAPSTLVAVIGDAAAAVTNGVAGGSANVGMESAGQLPVGVVAQAVHLRAVWTKARQHSLVYTLVDADPLAPVVSEWARWLQGQENELELAIGTVSAIEMPDYYLLDEHLAPPAVDWYLANLGALAPSRVIPVEMNPGPVAAVLGSLPYGRPFPPVAEVIVTARHFVPLPQLVVSEQVFD